VLRPYPVAVAGIFVTSVLVNSLLVGLPATATGWTFYLVIIVIQTIVISAGTIAADRVAEQNEQRGVPLSGISFRSFLPEPISGTPAELAESGASVTD